MFGRGPRTIVAGLVVAGSALAIGSLPSDGPALAVAEPSAACEFVNDDDNGLDGEQSWFQEISTSEFAEGERLVITAEKPAVGEATHVRIILQGTRVVENLRRPIASLPFTL